MSTTITGPVIKDYTITADKFTFTFGGSSANVFRNKFINGDFAFNQRFENTPTTISTSNKYTLDNWWCTIDWNASNTVSISSSTDVPTGAAGDARSLKYTVIGGSTPTLQADGICSIQQYLEGPDIVDLKLGTLSAESFTTSFWVKTNRPGTYSYRVRVNSSNNQLYVAPFNVNNANTWEYKSITIPPPTGTFQLSGLLGENNSALSVRIVLGAGSNLAIATPNTWSTNGFFVAVPTNVNILSQIGSYFQLANVQLEKGSVATDFEYLPYDIKLRRCQRYYQKSYRQGVVPGTAGLSGYDLGNPSFLSNYVAPSLFATSIQFPVQMRTKPTITYYAPSTGAVGQIQKTDQITTLTVATNTEWDENGIGLIVTTTNGAAGEAYQVQYTADASLLS